MKFLNRLATFLGGFFHFLILLLVLVALILVIQWRINHLFATSLNRSDADITLQEQIVESADQLENLMQSTISSDKTSLLDIPAGSDADDIAHILQDKGYITDAQTFVSMIKDKGMEPYLSAGVFEIPKDAKAAEILDILTKQKVDAATRTVQIEIPEQATPEIVGQILYDNGMITDKSTFHEMIRNQGLENSFIPGGYTFELPMKVQEIINRITGQDPEQSPRESIEYAPTTPEIQEDAGSVTP